jgi:hypothetical protein
MKRKSRLRQKKCRMISVRGIAMTAAEYKDFVDYLNQNNVQQFTKQDVSNFLEARTFR